MIIIIVMIVMVIMISRTKQIEVDKNNWIIEWKISKSSQWLEDYIIKPT